MTDLPGDFSEFLEQRIKASTTFVNRPLAKVVIKEPK